MNKLILKQLEKLNLPNKPDYDESSTYILFPRIREPIKNETCELLVNGVYKVVLANYITNPPENFTLDATWNQGRKITDTTLIIQINKFVGKMVQFTGRGYDFKTELSNDRMYENMWVPLKAITYYERVQ